MPLISVITAVHGPTAQYFADTIDSVLMQELPNGWEVEYVIQEDGDRVSMRALLDELTDGTSRVRYEPNRAQLGVAVTRNLALSRARGDLVQLLDHDDLLLPGAFSKLIPHFIDRSIHWAIGQADDLMPDGSRKAYPAALSFGRLLPGQVNDWAFEHGGNWPIHCAALMVRTVTLRALGGWGAVPSDDDIHAAVGLFQLTAGYQDEALTWLYRNHAGQTHKTSGWQSKSHLGRLIVMQRAAALRAFGITLPDAPNLPIPVKNVAPSLKEHQSQE